MELSDYLYQSLEKQIIFEDNHLLGINKAIGQIVQGDKTGDPALTDLFKAFIKRRDNKPGDVFMGLIHRLDRPVSGVLLLAKTSKGLSRMNEQFKQKETRKIYWAVVSELPSEPEGIIHSWLRKDEKRNMSFSHPDDRRPGSKEATTKYRLLASAERYHLLEVEPETGRHHQIRVHLSSIGCPIRGDLKYGSKRSVPGSGIFLHARKLIFNHPVKQEPVEISAAVPQDKLWLALEGMAL
jgi:23S rRNA pseudouridine1911/1915/1917 synthase